MLLLLLPTVLLAQSTNNETLTYEKAEKAYMLGQFPLSLEYLGSITKSSSWIYQSEKHHLAALCYLALDDENAAKAQVASLLSVNPYYSISASDPSKLVTMIEAMRNGQASLVTASQMAESLDEAPVPVTLITAEMIKMCGARNIKDVLLLYVPGMTDVESSNQTNIAYHGIYSTGQEKILIMLNGHRLNNRSMNSQNVDYSIDLNKVKQIEVLRGPASALYGNVALTAVVNIITFNGADTNKITADTEVGNFGQYSFGMQIGKRFNNFDLYAWLKYYNIDGETYTLSRDEVIGLESYDGSTALLGSYSQKPSTDMGLTLSYKGFSLLFSRSFGKRSLPLSDIDIIGAPYAYDSYGKYYGNKPGTGVMTTSTELSYDKTIGKIDIKSSFYYDHNTVKQYMVAGHLSLGDSIQDFFQHVFYDETTYGLSLRSTFPYKFSFGKGSLLCGFQGERSHMGNSSIILGKEGTKLYMLYHLPIFLPGTEFSYSGVVQIKHYFLPNVILNAGLRYDMKIRANHKRSHSLAPRLSFIYIHNLWNVKLSYSRSFVDAPYYYRYNISPSYRGSENLNPEHLSAIQLTGAYHTSNNVFEFETNLYHNHLTDFIYRDISATGDAPRYLNAGKINIIGCENTIHFKYKGLHANSNITWQNVLSGEKYSFRGKRIYNIPIIFGNLLCGYKKTYHKTCALDFNLIAHFTGSQLSPYENVLYNGISKTDENNMVAARCIFDTGVNVEYKKIEFSLFSYNIFDQHYKQGGSTSVPYYQIGRSVRLKLKYSF
jgi:outer membrane receptor for ferrienterochelin and colicins